MKSCEATVTARADTETKKKTLDDALKATQDAVREGRPPDSQIPTLHNALQVYAECMRSLPGILNGYAAAYAALDPFIKARLASEEDVRFLGTIISGLEQWHDLEISLHIERIQEELQDLIRQTRQFIEKKQKEILGLRDQEIKNWYHLLGGGSRCWL